MVKLWISTLALAIGLAVLPTFAWGQSGSAPVAAPKLSDAWLSSLPSSAPVAWSHAFALRRDTAELLETQRRRLIAEIDTLLMLPDLNGNTRPLRGLTAWRQQLAEDFSLPARTPGRHDLPWLGAHLRQDLPLSKIALWGSCEPPAWVEIWHLAGVTRLPWQEGMQLSQAIERASEQSSTGLNASSTHAWLITPTGERHRRGIAAWNTLSTPLTAGSRVVLELPSPQGLVEALPLMNAQAAGQLVNERLPEYLATRLPGEECAVFESKAQESSHQEARR